MSPFLKIKNFWQRYGWNDSVIFFVFKSLQTIFNLNRQEVILLELANLSDKKIALPAGYSGGFIDYETLRIQSAEDPELEMDEEFLKEAIEKQDLCYAISNNDRIVSYGWYSQKPTKMKEDLYFYFDNQYVYMYKGVTKPEFRGKRLHAVGMAAAMQSPQLQNSKGMVSCVERQNLASLKSVYRMGYRRTGSVYWLNFWGHYYNYSTPGCQLTQARTQRRRNVTPIATYDVQTP